MEITYSCEKPAVNPYLPAFRRLLIRAVREGFIREDRLQFHFRQLELDPDAAREIYEFLAEEHIRLIPPVEDPVYDPEHPPQIPELLERYASLLSERETRIMELRFIEHKDLTQTAELMGLSRERVRQIESKVIHMFHRRLRPNCRRKFTYFE